MLPVPLRVTTRSDHRLVARRGRRCSAGPLTVHLLAPGPGASVAGPARAGLVVGAAVGNAVARHRVSRRLRALLATRLPTLAPGTLVVVRAGAAAAPEGSDLAGALDNALGRLDRHRR